MAPDQRNELQKSPYEILAHIGVTVDSSMKELRDALFLLMEKGSVTLEERKAWETLRHVHTRLAADFFQYWGKDDEPIE